MRERGRMSGILDSQAQIRRTTLGQDDTFMVDSSPLDFGDNTPSPDAPSSSPAIDIGFGDAMPAADAAPAQGFDGSMGVESVTITSPDQVQELAIETPPVIDNPIFSAIDVNKLVQAGGVIYKYVRQTDAAGAVKYTPQRVNVRQAGTKQSGKLIALGIAAALILAMN